MDSEYKRVLSPSIGLLVVAALTLPEHTVRLEDENVHRLNLADSPDLVGITVNVDTSSRAYEIADIYRRRGIAVVLGGIHPSACPDQALLHADAVCIGEAERVWPQILTDVQHGMLQRTYYDSCPTDLAITPMPRWDLLDHSHYLYTNIVCASRGCPFACEFCYNSCSYVHNKYRNRPVAHVVDEIRRLGTRQVLFIDDNFAGDMQWTREFCRAVMPLGLTWHCAVSTNIARHPALLDVMSEAGCRSLFIGFESINGKSNEQVAKRQNDVAGYDSLIQQLHQRGIMVNASMVFGFDQDRPSIFKDTLDWLVANKVETMTGHILTPYPGTVLHRKLMAENRIIDLDHSHYNTAHVVYKPKQMSPLELQEGYLWIYEKFYSLPSIYARMPRSHQRRAAFLLFNLGYRKYGKVTSLVHRLGLMNAVGRLARRLAYGID